MTSLEEATSRKFWSQNGSYERLDRITGRKWGKIIAEPKELIRITKSNIVNS